MNFKIRVLGKVGQEQLGIVSSNRHKHKFTDIPLKCVLILIHRFQWDVGEIVLMMV